MATLATFTTSRKCKNFNSSLYTVAAEMLYFRKHLTNSQKTCCGYCVWNFQVLSYFCFAMATLQLFQHPENVKISILPFTMSQQKCYIFESIWRIHTKLSLAERRWRLLLCLKISRGQIFSFCNGNVTTFPTSRKCKKLQFYPLHSHGRNAIFSKVFNEFSKNFFFAERRWKWLF